MSEISSLISQLHDSNPLAIQAAKELIIIGLPAVSQLIEAARQDFISVEQTWVLEVLTQIQDPEIIPIWIDILNDENFSLANTAFTVLGYVQDELALPSLISALNGPRDTLAVDALGNLGNPKAIPSLLEFAHELQAEDDIAEVLSTGKSPEYDDFYEKPLLLLPRVVIALSKLGNQDLASLILPLCHYRSTRDLSDIVEIRALAVEALQHVVIPGMGKVLQTALYDEFNEVVLNAIIAMQYVGNADVINALSTYIQKSESKSVKYARQALQRITGVNFTNLKNNAFPLQDYKYLNDVCYRLGEPLSVETLIGLFAKPDERQSLRDEINIITNSHLGHSLYKLGEIEKDDNLLIQAHSWWNAHSDDFTKLGGLYKHGRLQSFQNIF